MFINNLRIRYLEWEGDVLKIWSKCGEGSSSTPNSPSDKINMDENDHQAPSV